jgi:hypothetical protein
MDIRTRPVAWYQTLGLLSMNKLKPFLILECDNVDIISSGLYNFIKDKTEILQSGISGWHFLDSKQVLDAVPELLQYFLDQKLYIRDSAITILDDDLALHIDPAPMVAKINFPVINTDGWVNRWYYISDRVTEIPLTITKFGHSVEDAQEIPKEALILAGEVYDMSKPMIFHSRIPHEVIKQNPSVTPRIIASFTFHNQPTHLLE